MMKPAFVLGNGKSRLAFDLNTFKTHGRVFGCNALYRDFTPHVLVATDSGIGEEIENSGYPLRNEFYTRNPRIEFGSKKIEDHWGFSSGPVAIKLAAKRGHTVIYLIGFDLASTNGLQNNVYSGSPNYKPADDQQTYYGNWVNQITTIMKEHPNQIFVRVIPEEGVVPFQWLQVPNYRTQSDNVFRVDINNKPWQKPKELATHIL